MYYNFVMPAGGPPNYRPSVDLSVAKFNADSDDLAIEYARKISGTFTAIPPSQDKLVLMEGNRVVCYI